MNTKDAGGAESRGWSLRSRTFKIGALVAVVAIGVSFTVLARFYPGLRIPGLSSKAGTVVGTKSLSVIVFNTSHNNPYNLDTIRATFFTNSNSVANYFAESSLGRLNIVPAEGGGVSERIQSARSCGDYKTWTRT